MANGDQDKNDRGNINISLPFSQSALLGTLSGQPPEDQGPLLSERQQDQQLTPNIVNQVPVVPSANFPEPAPAPVPEQPPLAQAAQGQDPRRAQLQDLLGNQFGQQQEQSQNAISSLEEAIRRAEKNEPGTAQAVGKSNANFSDAFFGTQTSKNVGQPETAQAREDRINKLKLAVAKQQGDPTKNQIDALKAALSSTGNQNISALLRDKRGKLNLKERQRQEFNRRKQCLADDAIKLGLPEFNTTINQIDAELPGGIEGFSAEFKETGKEIDGIGGLEGRIPDGRLGAQGLKNRQLAKSLASAYIRSRSGTAASDSERAALLGELGIQQVVGEGGSKSLVFSGGLTSLGFINGVQRLKDVMLSNEDTLRRAYGDDIFDEVAPGFKENRARRQKPVTVKKIIKNAAQNKRITADDLENMTQEELDAFNAGE